MPRILRLLFLSLAFSLALWSRQPALGQAPATSKAQAPAVEPLRTAGDRPIDVQHIRLDLRVDLPKKTVDGVATLRIKSLRGLRHVSLDAVGFEVKKVALTTPEREAAPVHFNHDGKKLLVDLEPAWPAGKAGTLRIEYLVVDPKDGLHFFGPAREDKETPLTVWSQGEPISNRHWFPCVDQPDQRQTTELVVTAAQGFEVISNGKLVERTENPSDKTVTFHWLQSQPHPAYLVTLVVGEFDVVREEWDKIPVIYYVPKGEKDNVARTFGRTREMLDLFSKQFGVHYPWEKYAQVVAYQFGGGMENTSATTLGNFMQDERSILHDNPDWVIAHELAHQWWGDLLTCRDWAHLWLNEGFASYAECLWAEHANGREAYDYNLYQKSGGAIEGGKNRPVVDRRYPNPSSMFDGRAYPKGAWVLHMLRRRLGDDAFWKSIQLYANSNRLKSVETSDFRRAAETESGRDLERFFYDWTERPGSPVLDVNTSYSPESKQARVVIKQTQPGEPFHFPLTIAFRYPDNGKPVVIEQDVTDKEYTIVVPLPDRPIRMEVDPGYTLLGEINETKDADLWRAQLSEGSNVPGRIRAAKHLAKEKTDANRRLLAQAFATEKFWGVRAELAGLMGEAGGDPSRDALLKGMHDPDARVRRACLDQLNRFKNDVKAVEAVRSVLKNGDPSYAVESAALRVYAQQGHKDAIALIQPWLSRPSHRDVLRAGALEALAQTNDPTVLNPLLDAAKPGHSRASRTAALGGLIHLTKNAKPTEEQRKQIMKELSEVLEKDYQLLGFGGAMALRDLGPAATPLLPSLDKLARNDPSERIRTFARETADKIRAKPAAAASPPPDLDQLRKEIERLKKEQEALRERLNKYEKAGSK
jgi:aminopeptidase N